MPQQDAPLHARLLEFSRYVISKIPKLNPQVHPLLFSDFINHSRKPRSYKNILVSCVRGDLRTSKSQHKFKTFIKDESYDVSRDLAFPMGLSTKNPRAIQCPSDALKTILLPIAHQFDSCLFSMPWFVKRIPVIERPAYVLGYLKPGPVAAGDYTSFEAHHQGRFIDIISEFVRHITSNYGNANAIQRFIMRIACGQNSCRNKSLEAAFKEGLLSGLPWTSTFNSVLNTCVSSFCALYRPWKAQQQLQDEFDDFRIVIEGDDSLFNASLEDEQHINNNFDRLGARARVEFHANPRHASFCGIVVNDQMHLATNPTKIVCNFFVIPKQYTHARDSKQIGLLKAKAYSYAHQYYKCPIVAHLCYNFCKRFKNFQANYTVEKQKYGFDETLAQMPKFIRTPPVISDSMRTLVAEKFGLPEEYQVAFEKALDRYGAGEDVDFPSHPIWDKYTAWSSRFTGDTAIDPRPHHDDGVYQPGDGMFATPYHRLPWRAVRDRHGHAKHYVFTSNGHLPRARRYPLMDPPMANVIDYPPLFVE